MLDLISHSSSNISQLDLRADKKKENWEDDDDWNNTDWLFGPIKA
jgi:hypothetical protein